MALDKGVFKERLLSLSEQFKKAGKTMSERDVCRRFTEPLFEALGWNLQSDEVKEQVSQPAGRPDYVFYLEGKIAFFLEAKKHGELDDAAIKQAVNYGRNRTKRWVVLSNFQETIILVCDIREDSIRKHVFRWVSLDNLDEAVDGLLLLSRENFLTGAIDSKAQSEGRIKKTVTVDDELLDDIWSWRTKLIKSIKESNKKEYTSDELEEIAQTILNRIIFIRTAEDRHHEAKPDETISNIIEAFRHGKTASIAERMNKLFKEYDETYDSKLFTYDESDPSKRHECELVKIGDNTYFEILKGTYDKNDIYSYNFGDIPADILGSMYEKYIGRIQSHRKEQGIYYTPTYIVDYIVRNTLGQLLKNKKPAEVEKLKVLDMACGSGSFLLRAFEVLDEYYRGKEGPVQQTELDTRTEAAKITRRTKILRNNIFGVDLDAKAVEIAQLNLLLKAAETRHRLPMLKDNIQHGNSLIDDPKVSDWAFKWDERFSEAIKNGGFDVIIGNPPYVRPHKLSIKDKQFFWKNLKTFKAKSDLYNCFMEKGIDNLTEGGLFSFIVPHTWTSLESFYEIRKYLLDTCRIVKLVQLPKKVFEDATVETCIFVISKERSERKRENNEIIVERLSESGKTVPVKKYIQGQIRKNHLLNFELYADQSNRNILQKIKSKGTPLNEFVDFFYGLKTGDDEKFISSSCKNLDYKKILRSKDINRYSTTFSNEWVWYVPDLMVKNKKTARPGEKERFEQEKVIVARMGKQVVATYDKEKYYVKDAMLLVKKTNDLNLKYLTGLLNSKVINYFYKNYFITIDVLKNALLDLPIVFATEKTNIAAVANLVDQMLSLHKKLSELGDKQTSERSRIEEEIAKTDKEIDNRVYDVYGLTKEERSIVEETVK